MVLIELTKEYNKINFQGFIIHANVFSSETLFSSDNKDPEF